LLLAVGMITALLVAVSPVAAPGATATRRSLAEKTYFYVLGRYPAAARHFDPHVSPPLSLDGGHVAIVDGRERIEGIKLNAYTTFRPRAVGSPAALAVCRALVVAVKHVPVRGVSDVIVWSRGFGGNGATPVAEAVAPHGCRP
jgi:hypothetical protein